MELQRIPEWYVDRLYKFTGSEFFKLMTGGRRDMTPAELEAEKEAKGKRKTVDTLFGDTALTYINDKIAEIITNGTCIDYKALDTKEFRWGKYWEPFAKEALQKELGIEIVECGFINISERFGCSPDGELPVHALEIKCPYNTTVHVKNLRLKGWQDLKEINYNYYVQLQIEIMALKKDKGLFVSFDPRCYEKLQLKIIEVPRDEELISEILYRKDEAVKILNTVIGEMYNLTDISIKIAV
jgi:YqaJ-like viral recombinase domain